VYGVCMCYSLHVIKNLNKGVLFMAVANRVDPMLRKQILMPKDAIKKANKIARQKKVSFGEVIRLAVYAYDGEISAQEETLLEGLAQQLIDQTNETVAKIDETIERMDKTHAKIKVIHKRIDKIESSKGGDK